MIDRLALIVPSRGRPQNIANLIRSLRATRSTITHLFVAVDDDDPTLPEYRRLFEGLYGDSETLVVGPRVRLGPTVNTVARQAVACGYRWVGFMGDDHRPRTVDWDLTMTAACGPFGMAYADDLFQRENLPTEIVMTANIVQALGHMSLPGLVHMFIDNYWLTLGQALGCIRYLPDVIVEHVHPAAGKAELDAGYGEAMGVFDSDHAVFEAWRTGAEVLGAGKDAEVAKLKEARDGSPAV